MSLEPCPCFRCNDPDCSCIHPSEEKCSGCCGFYCTSCVHWDFVVDNCIYPRVADIYKCEEN